MAEARAKCHRIAHAVALLPNIAVGSTVPWRLAQRIPNVPMTNDVLEPRLAKMTGASGSNGGARGNGTTCRMFENDWLERFSRIHPATPFVAWVPVVGFFLVRDRKSVV